MVMTVIQSEPSPQYTIHILIRDNHEEKGRILTIFSWRGVPFMFFFCFYPGRMTFYYVDFCVRGAAIPVSENSRCLSALMINIFDMRPMADVNVHNFASVGKALD